MTNYQFGYTLEYDILESIATHSNSLGKRSAEYGESLENKIISGISSVTGSSSRYLESASDSVRDKINALNLKSKAFYHFSEQITDLLELAQQIDQEVADVIAAHREYVLDHHKSLWIEDWKAKLLGLVVNIKNSIPLLGTIAVLLGRTDTIPESLEDSIKHWYERGGGKQISDIAVSATVAGWNFSDLKSSGKNGIVDLKNNIKLWYRASENDIASANITNSAKSSSKTEVAEKPISTISALPDDYIPSSEPDYPQLGPGMAVLLGMDSVLNFGIVNVINTVNSFTGKQPINQEVIDYNKETTTDFADRYKVGQATGWGAEVLAIVGLFKGGSVKGTTEGTGNATKGVGILTGSLDKLTPAERTMVNDLLGQGKSVEIVPRSNVQGVKTPDFKVNGVLTELKSLEGTSLNTPVTRIQKGFSQGAQTVIIDGRATGLTAEQANTVINRINGIYVNGVPGKIEIWTNEGIIFGGK